MKKTTLKMNDNQLMLQAHDGNFALNINVEFVPNFVREVMKGRACKVIDHNGDVIGGSNQFGDWSLKHQIKNTIESNIAAAYKSAYFKAGLHKL